VADTLQLMEQYVGSFVRRLVAKPFELGGEVLHDPRRFLITFPGRVVTKPFRVVAELRTTLDIVRGKPGPRRLVKETPEAREFPPARRAFRLLLSAPLLWAHDTLDVLQTAAELGYDGVELWAFSLFQEGQDPQVVRRRARDLGLVITLHALSWDLNPTSRLESIRRASVAELHRSVDLASDLGAELVALHPGRVTVPYDDGAAYWDTLVGVLRELADHAAQVGVRLGLEHMESRQGEYVVEADQVKALVRAVDRPNLGITLDVAHIPWGEDEADFVRRLGPVVHVHFSDADESRLHLPLGHGKRDLLGCLRALTHFTGCVVLEGFSMSADDELARWNKGRFEELWHEVVSS
jgi:sugar phosphate isomerase/epimerase